MSRKLIITGIPLVAIVGAVAGYLFLAKPALPPGIAGGNGRLEGKQVDITTNYQGRIAEFFADEGDTVEAGQVVAKMDVEPLEAQFPKART